MAEVWLEQVLVGGNKVDGSPCALSNSKKCWAAFGFPTCSRIFRLCAILVRPLRNLLQCSLCWWFQVFSFFLNDVIDRRGSIHECSGGKVDRWPPLSSSTPDVVPKKWGPTKNKGGGPSQNKGGSWNKTREGGPTKKEGGEPTKNKAGRTKQKQERGRPKHIFCFFRLPTCFGRREASALTRRAMHTSETVLLYRACSLLFYECINWRLGRSAADQKWKLRLQRSLVAFAPRLFL